MIKQILKYRGLLLLVVVFAFVFRINVVSASTFVPVSEYFKKCDVDRQLLRPYNSLILVDLKKMYKEPIYPLTSSQVNNEILYEMLYVKKAKYSPFNAIYREKVFFHTCDALDYTLPYVKLVNNNGAFVLGVFDHNAITLQEIVDKYYISEIDQGTIQFGADAPKITNIAKCTNCGDIVTRGDITQRPYDIKIQSVSFAKSVKQKQKVKFDVVVKNNGKVPIPGKEFLKMVLKKKSGDSLIYNPIWVDLKTVGVINPNKYVLQNETFTYSFEVGPFIEPRQYNAKFIIAIGNNTVKNTEFTVSFKVKNSGLKLATISPKEGSFANVHTQPAVHSPVSFKIDAGEIVIWHKQEGAFVYIETRQGHKGWVYRPFVRPR